MTSDEFKTWLDYHTQAFPAIADWLGNHSSQLQFWQKALRDVSLANAKMATDAIFSGSITRPQGFGNHPAVIRRYAKDQRPDQLYARREVFFDGDQAHVCPTCEDTGHVLIWNPVVLRFLNSTYGEVPDDWRSRKEVRDAYRDPEATYRTRRGEKVPCKLPAQEWLNTACTCDTGHEYAQSTKRYGRQILGMLPYDKNRMCAWSNGRAEDATKWLTENEAIAWTTNKS